MPFYFNLLLIESKWPGSRRGAEPLGIPHLGKGGRQRQVLLPDIVSQSLPVLSSDEGRRQDALHRAGQSVGER